MKNAELVVIVAHLFQMGMGWTFNVGEGVADLASILGNTLAVVFVSVHATDESAAVSQQSARHP